ncbi:MAG: Antitoxin VbhA [Patescibacteria group bacterium]|nr:Antitoxin VbhA [Patescibacteria group bacterium]
MDKSAQKRKNVIKQAIANEKLEGLNVSKESIKIAESYIAGKASAKEAAAKIRARYGAI